MKNLLRHLLPLPILYDARLHQRMGHQQANSSKRLDGQAKILLLEVVSSTSKTLRSTGSLGITSFGCAPFSNFHQLQTVSLHRV